MITKKDFKNISHKELKNLSRDVKEELHKRKMFEKCIIGLCEIMEGQNENSFSLTMEMEKTGTTIKEVEVEFSMKISEHERVL